MGIPILGDILREVGATVRQVIPDPIKQREFDLKFAELADKADARENDLLKGQLDVNKEEAKHANLFVAGWRPFIGWTGGAALAYTWIVAPFMTVFPKIETAPALDPNAIYPIVLAMLGVGTMRTVEKLNGVATSVGGKVLTPVKRAEVAKVVPPAPALDINEERATMEPVQSPGDPVKPTKKRKWFS